jgi:hypothetical protein
MINRISINGKRYIVSLEQQEVEGFCNEHNIPKKWIRWSERFQKYYLRLWGRFLKCM